jgi:phosphoglycolate phosphatase
VPTVVFWDIDGTLLSTGGAGMLAWECAVEDLYGIQKPHLADLQHIGLTDRQIAARLVQRFDARGGPAQHARLIERYENHLPSALERRSGAVMPGAREILAHLLSRREVASLVLTGNTPVGGRTKLRHFDLLRYFPMGGAFCTTLGERDEIARSAHAVASELFPRSTAWDAYVIGDTPEDMKCARTIDARGIGMTTGVYRAEELEAAGAWALLECLPPVPEFADLVGLP